MALPAEQNLSATLSSSQFYQAAGQDTEPTCIVDTASFNAMYCLCASINSQVLYIHSLQLSVRINRIK